jgi:hypothetical protein
MHGEDGCIHPHLAEPVASQAPVRYGSVPYAWSR